MNFEELRVYKQKIDALAEQHGIQDVRVFGSIARGDAHDGSDIDFLVNLKPGTRYSGYLKFMQSLTDMIGKPVQVVEESAIVHPLVKQSIFEDLRNL